MIRLGIVGEWRRGVGLVHLVIVIYSLWAVHFLGVVHLVSESGHLNGTVCLLGMVHLAPVIYQVSVVHLVRAFPFLSLFNLVRWFTFGLLCTKMWVIHNMGSRVVHLINGISPLIIWDVPHSVSGSFNGV